MVKRKRILILDEDPHKDFKLEIIELIKTEINYVVNKTLMKVLLWVIVVLIPTATGWGIIQYKNNQLINNIESNWSSSDSIIQSVGRKNYERDIDKIKFDSACKEVERLKEVKADKIYVDEMLLKIDKEFDRTRQFENEIIKRQDLMLKHLLDIKREL